MKLLNKLLFAVLILSACGTRKTSSNKDLQIDKSTVKLESKFNSQDQLFFSEKSLAGSNETNLETTIVREYHLDSNGKPFLAKETVSNSNQQKQQQDSRELEANSKSDIKINNLSKYSTYKKDLIEKKDTEADKTLSKNLGGGGILLLIIIAVLIAFFIYHKRKK
ncbi:hypothetical protein D3C87_664200 [compost metagenome]